jgi:predicted regulator of Ras-like GTPase activity (Roadblock/LC7/MglB family)
MDSEFFAFALKNTLDEMQKACPDIQNAFVLDQNHTVIAQDENTTEEIMTRAVEILNEMFEKADAIGGMDDVIIDGTNGQMNISRMEEIYLVTVTSKKTDVNYVNTVVHVLVPTVLKLLEKLNSGAFKPELPEPEQKVEIEPEDLAAERSVEFPSQSSEQEQEEETRAEEQQREEKPREETVENIVTEQPANQFIVEDMKGLLTPSDIVRIDNNVMEKWNEYYENRTIEEADIETFGGKSVRCKVKPIKDAKLEGQGKVQIPGKMQLVLDIKKGELVRVKPVVE